jgi:L-threonylcarbamoyladenylate synthase
MTERWPADPEHIAQTVEGLRRGAVIAFPTDTLYAVGCRAGDRAAVKRLYAVKRRPSNQPMVWLVKDRAQVEGVAAVDARAADLIKRFWPGPLTLVLPSLHEKHATLAVRAPNHPVALALLEQLGESIASSSANRAADRPPVDADEVIAGLGGDLDIVLDGGRCQIGQPSTILDLSVNPPRILRQGAIPAEDLLA